MKNNKNSMANPYVFMDFTFNNVKAGRVVIELFRSAAPKAVENFRALCTGEKGLGVQNRPLHYRGTKITRVVPVCMVQGGDIINNDGTGGESIYGRYFDDEKFTLKHELEGMVGMSNDGKNRNSSQFYITTVPCAHLDDTNIIVGRVVKGLNTIVEMSDIPRNNLDRPLEDIIVQNCGEFKPGEPWNLEENDNTEDVYPPWPNDWDINSEQIGLAESAIQNIKKSGNYFFNKKNYIESERKYIKALRYIDWCLGLDKNNEKVKKLRIIAILNLCAVRLKMNKNREVVKLCTEVIKESPNNVKAYYRRAHARLAMKDYDLALKDLHEASLLNPNDEHILKCINVTKDRKSKYLTVEKRMFGKLFN